MTGLSIRAYDESLETLWDDFCAKAINATLLHTRKFLSYHGDRFEDASLLIYEEDRLLGVLPAARASQEAHLVVSHPGATYGGIVHDGRLIGGKMIAAFEAVSAYYRQQQGFSTFLYKALPYGYALVPGQDDLYALFRLDAVRVRCDLTSCIDLSHQRPLSERRRRSLKKAQKSVAVDDAPGSLPELWDVLTDNLARRHGARPVHTLEEITLLAGRFPDDIALRCARHEGRLVAGILLFLSRNVWHAQYIASSEEGYDLAALDAVFNTAIEDARNAGARYFSFGSSNEQSGRILNEGLYAFKSEFGGGGMAHEFYELTL